MAYDEILAQRLGAILASRGDIEERRMFGGIAFMAGGHMCVGVSREDLMVRIGPDQYDAAVELPAARPMDFTGKPMRGFVIVDPSALSDESLKGWVDRAVAFVETLPQKKAK